MALIKYLHPIVMTWQLCYDNCRNLSKEERYPWVLLGH